MVTISDGEWRRVTTSDDECRYFYSDPETEGIVMIGEIGGSAEEQAARLLRDDGSAFVLRRCLLEPSSTPATLSLLTRTLKPSPRSSEP